MWFLILWPFVFSQLYRLCWSLRNSTEERIDLEVDDWTGDQDSSSMEAEGIMAYSIQYSTVHAANLLNANDGIAKLNVTHVQKYLDQTLLLFSGTAFFLLDLVEGSPFKSGIKSGQLSGLF